MRSVSAWPDGELVGDVSITDAFVAWPADRSIGTALQLPPFPDRESGLQFLKKTGTLLWRAGD